MDIKDSILSALAEARVADDAGLCVALSGGADSTALLLALAGSAHPLTALHCNFELRGIESDGDEAACRRLCRQAGVELVVKHFRTRSYAARRGISIEMAARELRYEWFAREVAARGCAALCVAHHRDDNVETMLLNLIRGTGLRGLTGMERVVRRSDGLVVVRPLLDVARADIESWLTQQGQEWQTDSSNLRADAALRNTVRLRLLPIMETMNPRIRETLAATASRLRDAETLYDAAIERERAGVVAATAHGVTVDCERLRSACAPRTLLYEVLAPYGFSGEQAADIFAHMDGESGHVWQSPRARLLRDRGRLIVEAVAGAEAEGDKETGTTAKGEACVVPLEGLVEWGGGRLLVRRQAAGPGFEVARDAATASFDMSRLQLPLVMRRVRTGDRFRPFGMTGTRLVSDLLTDMKVPLFERERQLVVLSGEEIVWVVGRRVAAGYEVGEATRHVMTLTDLLRPGQAGAR